MCVRITAACNIPIRRRNSVMLCKNALVTTPLVSDHAQYITKDVNLNSLSIFLLNMADRLAPILNKNNKICKPVMTMFERAISSFQHFA